jgi:hypothetical protein
MIGESDNFFNVVVCRYLHILDYLVFFDKLWIAARILALLLSEMPILWTGNAETHGNVTVKDKVEIKWHGDVIFAEKERSLVTV